MDKNPNDLITVCNACYTAACWQGVFMCQHARNAGTIQKPRHELEKLALEHPSYLKTDEELQDARD